MIWNYCLVVDEINPYPECYESNPCLRRDKQRLDVALLRTHRMITAETRSILYGQNLFTVSSSQGNKMLLAQPAWGPRLLLTRLQLTFDFRDAFTGDQMEKFFQKIEKEQANDLLSGPMILRRKHNLHSYQTDSLLRLWKPKVDFIVELKLKQLVLDFKKCYCPTGCCRLVFQVARLLDRNRGLAYAKCDEVIKPKEVVLTGLRDDRETTLIDTALWTVEERWNDIRRQQEAERRLQGTVGGVPRHRRR